MSLIVDASLALTWCFPDEATSATDALSKRASEKGIVVPTLWHIEMTNGLIQGERRKRISASQIAAKLEMLEALLIETDHETVGRVFRETLMLARAHRLTAYDACYLELALRRGLPLATLDQGVGGRSAKELGVEVLG